nr:MAG TPA: hypothetical protein [Caudoviricetes sp.]
MKAYGCLNRRRDCAYPNDPYAEIIPLFVDLDDQVFRYWIEWDHHYRNAPAIVRTRHVCIGCATTVAHRIENLIAESHAIDRYYERSDRENAKQQRRQTAS